MYFSAHTHSRYSAKDALPTVEQLVERAADLDQPALGLTDHGTVAGIFELYKYARRAGLMPVPGVELYVAINRHQDKPVTKHLGVVATTTKGWENLIGLANHTMRSYRYKPLVDLNDLAIMSQAGGLDGLSVTTGCFFGLANAALTTGGLAARNVLTFLADVFDGRVYVEVQNHRISDDSHDDRELIRHLTLLADQVGLPMVVTNDAHYAYRHQQPMHNLLKFLSSWSDNPDDAIFPGDGYWLCSEAQMRSRFDENVWFRGVEGLEHMLAGHDLVVPELDTFTARVPQVISGDSAQALRDRVNLEADRRILPAEYGQRIEEELDVIIPKGFADYLLLVASITDWMHESGIAYNARGSASGSLVCWLLGITSVDPIAYDLRFDRFLSVDRIKPPDIDLDVEHTRRGEVIEWLEQHHPCARIGNWREVGLSEADTEKGSLWVKWAKAARAKGLNPQKAADHKLLEQLSDAATYDGMGIHAAGIVVAPDAAALTRIPMQWIANSATMVTALDMDNIEEIGLIKVDLLGVRTLTAVSETFKALGKDPDEVPLDDKEVFARMASGDTTGIFQLQGYTAANGCKQMKPRTFADVVHAMALFRKASIQSGATGRFMECRSTRKKSQDPKRHAIIKKHTTDTYGEMIYQEQVLGILGDMGMDAVELSKVLKAVKASNANIGNAAAVMHSIEDRVTELARAHEMSDGDISWLMAALNAYAEYGFNKSHAVSYGRIAYLTAWLLVHAPELYWASLMTQYSHDLDALAQMRATAKKVDDITFLEAHVNESGVAYKAAPPKVIIDSLALTHGVGEKACKEIEDHAPYTSVWDLADRCNGRLVTGSASILKGHTPDAAGGVIQALYEAGALAGLPNKPPNWDKEN